MKSNTSLSNPRSYQLSPLGIFAVQQNFNPHPDKPSACKHCGSERIITTRTRRSQFWECIDCENWLGDVNSRVGHSRYNRLYSNKLYQAFSEESVSVFEVLGSTDVNILLSDAAIEICYLFHNEKAPTSVQGKIKELTRTLAHKGAAINFAAIAFLKVFHPEAMDIYFGRKK